MFTRTLVIIEKVSRIKCSLINTKSGGWRTCKACQCHVYPPYLHMEPSKVQLYTMNCYLPWIKVVTRLIHACTHFIFHWVNIQDHIHFSFTTLWKQRYCVFGVHNPWSITMLVFPCLKSDTTIQFPQCLIASPNRHLLPNKGKQAQTTRLFCLY